MSLFAELKRRNVFKVGVAYIIVAWLLIQVASILFPTFHAPEWVMQVFTVIIILGFPLAIFLAWAYELTPEGIKAASSVGPAQYHTRTTGQRLNYFILALVLLVIAYLMVDHFVLTEGPRTATVASVPERTAVAGNSTKVSAPVAATPRAAPPLRVRRSSLILGDLSPLPGPGYNALIALSPNGEHLVYLVNEAGTNKLYHRALDQLTAQEVPAAGGGTVFFSPDGEWVGLLAKLKLYKISILGGPPQQLADPADFGHGGFWTPENVIYFSIQNKLQRIAATGGTPEPVTIQSDLAERAQSWPWELPGGTHLLFTSSQGTASNGQIALLSLKTGATRILIQNGYNARYVPTGHIVFMRSASLWAVPFDVARLETTGPEVPVVNGVATESLFGSAVYAFSDDGQLVYLPGEDARDRIGGRGTRNLVWVDREGKETPLDAVAQTFYVPRLSPDGRQVALTIGNLGASTDIWTYDLERNTLSRRTFSGNALAALWTPDGERLVYTFFPDYHGLAWVKADGTGQPEQLLDAPRLLAPTAFSPDGSQLVYNEVLSGPQDIYTLSMTGKRTEQALLATGFNEQSASLSPDGRWMAYQSNETGRDEIYVRPFPKVEDGKWQISTGGGHGPRWRGDGKELYYSHVDGNDVTIIAVNIDTEPRFQAGTPVKLFTGNYITDQDISVTADGQKFLLLKAAKAASEDIVSRLTSLVIVENWFGELKRLAPAAQ